MAIENETLLTLTSLVVSADVSNNSVATADVGGLIEQVYGAIRSLGAPDTPPDEKPKGAVSVRASIKPEHLISMIDGKPYKMLKRHLGFNGHTPESYREAYGLPHDYPMVAKAYADYRSALAKKIGFGRKPKSTTAPVELPQPVRKPRGGKANPTPSED